MKSVSADNGKNTFCGYTRRECIYLGAIFLIVVFFRLCWSYSHTATWLVGDSYSYMNFNLVATLRLHAVNGRPPAYGCLLYLLHFLGDHYLEIVTLLQKLCSLSALPFFLGILRRVGLNTGWSGIVLLLSAGLGDAASGDGFWMRLLFPRGSRRRALLKKLGRRFRKI